MRKPIPKKSSLDGINWPKDREEQINGAFRSALNSPAGELVVDYLRAITIEMVLGPVATDAELRHREGMRQLFQIIEQRRTSKPEEM
jgi:hypothetical protein